MKLNNVLAIGLAGAMVMSMAACGGSKAPETKAPETKGTEAAGEQTSDEKINLTFYAWADEEGIFTTLADAYMKEHENVTITLNFTPSDDYPTKLMTAFSAGDNIDAFAVASPPSLAEFVSKDAAQPLDELLAGRDISGYEGIMKSLEIDGKNYALPYKSSAWVVYYNKDLFDAAGVDYPSDDWTWEEYAEIAEKLTNADEGIYGSLNFQPTSMWWRVPANSKSATNPLEDDQLEAWMDAMEYVKSLSDAGAQPLYEDMASEAGADYAGNFLSGKYAMVYNGDWLIEMLNTSIANGEGDINYDIAALPHWEGKDAVTPGAAGSLQVAAASKNPEAALDFIYFCSAAQGSGILLENDYFPAWQDENTIAAYCEGKTSPEHIEYIVNQTIISQVPCNQYYNSATNVIKEEASLYLIGEQDKETTLENCKKRIQDEVLTD